MKDMIYTTQLTKRFGDSFAVDDVNLAIKKGEIFGFLGLNGAGKTTTIRMLLGMIAPTSGACYLNGEKVSAGKTSLWNDVGYIVETPYSYPELTVRDNLEIARKLRGLQDKHSVDWIMNKLVIEKYADKKAKHLSLGNAQRLGIAKAMIHKPKILILDEPTNGLDPAGIVEVRELLLELARNSGVTILISSHKLAEISKITTNMAIIHHGKLIKELDGSELEDEIKRTLILDGKNKASMAIALSESGYVVDDFQNNHITDDGLPVLRIQDTEAINHPAKIATLLVNAGHPPTLLKVEKEDLEAYFSRVIQEVEEAYRE